MHLYSLCPFVIIIYLYRFLEVQLISKSQVQISQITGCQFDFQNLCPSYHHMKRTYLPIHLIIQSYYYFNILQ